MRQLVLLLLATLQLVVVVHGNCFDATFETAYYNFNYRAILRSEECNLSNTTVTPLYMLGACCKEHRNNFGLEPPICQPGDWNILNTSTGTCNRVFAEGADNPNLRTGIQSGVPFDTGQICTDGIYGVIFVQTDCPSLNASSITLEQWEGHDDLCWHGNTLSKGALSGIVVGCVIGVAVLAVLPAAICWWRWKRSQRKEQDLEAARNGKAAGVVSGTSQATGSKPSQEIVSGQLVQVSHSTYLRKLDPQQSKIHVPEPAHAYSIELESQESQDDVPPPDPEDKPSSNDPARQL